jgi:hypothetical protein
MDAERGSLQSDYTRIMQLAQQCHEAQAAAQTGRKAVCDKTAAVMGEAVSWPQPVLAALQLLLAQVGLHAVQQGLAYVHPGQHGLAYVHL